MTESLSTDSHREAPIRNRLLHAISPRDLQKLWPYLVAVELKPRQTIHHSGTPMETICFIESGLVSVSAKVSPSQWVEVWLIGSEGMTGLPVVLGDAEDPSLRRVVQVGGSAYQISRADFQQVLEYTLTLKAVLLKYAQFVLLQTSQSAVCESHHSLKQRLCRWLLLASDGLGKVELPLTHQMLARLLGVRRASITQCLSVLEEEGALENTRALIRVRDQERLKSVACGCYGLITGEYRRLIG